MQNGAMGYRDETGEFVRVDNRHYMFTPPRARVFRIVLTIAHLGRPAHAPVHFHVTRSTEADEIIQIVGFLMPPEAEQPEWQHMMHRRALAEFARCAPAVSAGFVIAFQRCGPGLEPRHTVAHEASAVTPEYAVLTRWRLLGEPSEAALIAAEATALFQVPPADVKRLSAALTDTFSEPAFRAAQCFVATGRRAGLDVVRGLLRGDRKDCGADHAELLPLTAALSSPNAGALNPDSDAGAMFDSAFSRAGFSRASGIVRERRGTDSAFAMEGALSRSSHTGILLHFSEYPENCADDNLKALCQRCHLRYDHEHHMQNAAVTRRKGKAVAELFDDSIVFRSIDGV